MEAPTGLNSVRAVRKTELPPPTFTLNPALLANSNKLSPRGRRDDMPPADGSSTVAKIAADLRPSADGSVVRTSLVAGSG